jgi:chemotaxis protein histidine kinase CheA
MNYVYHAVKKAGGDVSVSSMYGKNTIIKMIHPCPEP